jgi:hypothetical protein
MSKKEKKKLSLDDSIAVTGLKGALVLGWLKTFKQIYSYVATTMQ